MEREDIERVLHKLKITEEDIVQMSETHSFAVPHNPSVRKIHKVYEVTLKDGTNHLLKMHHITKQIKEKGEIGYDLMIE